MTAGDPLLGTPRRIPVARHVDGFVLPIPKQNAAAYRRIAQIGREHGAPEHASCIADDLCVAR